MFGDYKSTHWPVSIFIMEIFSIREYCISTYSWVIEAIEFILCYSKYSIQFIWPLDFIDKIYDLQMVYPVWYGHIDDLLGVTDYNFDLFL